MTRTKVQHENKENNRADFDLYLTGIKSILLEQKNKREILPQNLPKTPSLNIYTLEQLDNPFFEGSENSIPEGFKSSNTTLQKRARRKQIALTLMEGLIKLKSPLLYAYTITQNQCVNVLLHEGSKITSSYCGYRWCPVCNAIRTGKLINGYLPAFREMKEPYFVTLTAPTVSLYQLDREINYRNKIFQDIRKYHKSLVNTNKIEFELNGIRKLEVVPRPDNFAHPHYHMIVDGKESANFIYSQWLTRIPTAVKKAQDVKPIDETGLIELFKYVTKFWSKDEETGNPKIATPYEMDQIYQSLKKRRTVQPFGNIRLVSEDINEIESIEMEGVTPKEDVSVWENPAIDWIDTYGELASGFRPSDRDKNLILQIEKAQSYESA